MTTTTAAAAHTHFVGTDGARICWHRFGSADGGKQPLVLLHGGHGSWRHWARNVEALAEGRPLWVPDMPGYGDSDELGDDSLPALVQRLAASVQALPGIGTRPFDLAGFSFGGLVAATLAAHLQAAEAPVPKVRRLALLGPGGHGGQRRPRGALQDWRAHAGSGDAAALAAVMRHNLLMHMLHAEASVDADALDIHTQACVRTRFRSKHISRAGGLPEAMAAHGGPVLLVWGAEDVTATPEVLAPALAASLPDGRAHVVPGAGHWVQYEAAGTVNALLAAWLDNP